MKAAFAGVIAAVMLVSGSGLAIAQSSTAPATQKMSADKMAGKHSVQGEVTRVDAKKGWVHVKTSEGTMIVHIPPADLQTVKKGDMVALDLSLKDNGPAPKK